jgi:hypothetical protein
MVAILGRFVVHTFARWVDDGPKPVVICPERTDEDWPPENFLINRSSAELRRLRIQPVDRGFALTLTAKTLADTGN